MVDNDSSKAAFSARLIQSLSEAGVREHGRGADVRAELLRRGVAATPQAVSKWLNGESIPQRTTLLVLSDWLGVRPEWLEYGIEPMRHTRTEESRATYGSNIEPALQPSDSHRYPVISWVQAGDWAESVDNFAPGDGESWESSSVNAGSHGFWLTVRGDSMTSPNGVTFPDGMLILVRPEMEPISGKFFVAKLTDTGETTFKQLILDGGRKYLRPLNPTYRTLEVNGNCIIVGRVVDARWRGL
jgi:SOS-response transcriptional repressor LexA